MQDSNRSTRPLMPVAVVFAVLALIAILAVGVYPAYIRPVLHGGATASSTQTPPQQRPSEPPRLPKDRRDVPYAADPNGPYPRSLKQAAAAAEADGRSEDGALLRMMATAPFASWWSDKGDLHGHIKADLAYANKVKRPALQVIYRIPGRDCGLYSSAEASADAASYLNELRNYVKLVNAVGANVITILEPDALTQFVDPRRPECAQRNPGRLELLAQAVGVLKSSHHVTVLIDAGNAGWLDSDLMVPALRKAGLQKADGVADNVANAKDTDASVAYGLDLVESFRHKIVLVDTGRNGLGPYTDGDPNWTWCNPPGRAFGAFPTTQTGNAQVMYAWVKLQGESDGDCQRGDPPPGTLMADYLIEQVKRSRW